jgi:hypothetical protein
VRLPFPTALAREFRWIDRADTVPAWAAPLLDGEGAAMEAAGLDAAGTYTVPMLGTSSSIGRVFLDREGLMIAQVMASRTEGAVTVSRVVASCTSRAVDDTLIATANLAEHLDAPPSVQGEVVKGSTADVVRRHRERLAAMTIVPCARDGLRDRLADEHALAVAFHERRGVYVPVRPDRLAALRAATPSEPPSDPLPAATIVQR